MDKIAVYTGTRNLYPHMVPAVKSLIMRSDVDKVYLLIEDDEFPYELPELVETRNVSDQKYFPHDGPNFKSRFTYMAMMRAALAKEFPEYDKILSLDVDTFAVQNMSELWDKDLTGYYFCASKEPDRSTHERMYVNVGVALYNLAMMREIVDAVIEKLNTIEYNFVEQDCLNDVCTGKIREMPSIYNATPYTMPAPSPKIIHYAGKGDWTDQPQYVAYSKLTWDEVMRGRPK